MTQLLYPYLCQLF